MSRYKKENIISHYVGTGYNYINSKLRKRDTDNYLIDLLDQTIEDIGKYDNNVVYREELSSRWEELSIWYKAHIGTVVKRLEFLSTSKKCLTSRPCNMIITTCTDSNSRDIEAELKASEPQRASDEVEVLFKRETNLKVIEVDNSNRIIYLEETKEESTFDFLMENVLNDEQVSAYLDSKSRESRKESLSDLGII